MKKFNTEMGTKRRLYKKHKDVQTIGHENQGVI